MSRGGSGGGGGGVGDGRGGQGRRRERVWAGKGSGSDGLKQLFDIHMLGLRIRTYSFGTIAREREGWWSGDGGRNTMGRQVARQRW